MIYLIYNHLNTKRFYELNPSIKELANLLYGIKSQSDFNRLLNIMARTRKQIINLMQQYPKQSTPNILPQFDDTNLNMLENDGADDKYQYDEYGQNITQNLRDMSSFELDTAIKRIQDLEFRQYGYTQPVDVGVDAGTDDDIFVSVVQDEDEAEKEEIAKHEQIQKEINDDEKELELESEEVKKTGYYNSVMERFNKDGMVI